MNIMDTQKLASQRNTRAELVTEFILAQAMETLLLSGTIDGVVNSESQKLYESGICRDVWDHYLCVSLPGSPETIEIWAQTTCYKGHGGGQTEPNKTYEVRETLTEAISLRATWPSGRCKPRLLHVTYGDPDYTYPWFRPAKASVFDLSVFVNLPGKDVYDAIADVAKVSATQGDFLRNLSQVRADPTNPPLGKALVDAIQAVVNWCDAGYPTQKMGERQAELISPPSVDALRSLMTRATGSGLKQKALKGISDPASVSDPVLESSIKAVLQKKPFLEHARDQLTHWSAFMTEVRSCVGTTKDMNRALTALWMHRDDAVRSSLRRILLRVHTSQGVDYAADFGVHGVSEHNLYGGTPSQVQLDSLMAELERRLSAGGISDPQGLVAAIDKRGAGVLAQLLAYETKNGTVNRFSFEYVTAFLEAYGYQVLSPKEAGILLVGYHAELTGKRVGAYTNFVVVRTRQGKALAILKTKAFSEAEFDRRCKEEGYVGLTLSHQLRSGTFTARQGLSLVMCIDMPSGFSPPPYSVAKLEAMGWSVAFGPHDLMSLLLAQH